MCGRYTLTSPAQVIADTFGVEGDLDQLDGGPRYNIAPGQEVWIVRPEGGAERRLARVRWGLVPAWTEKAPAAATMINARAETAAEKPAFRQPFRRRRCLVPADGFYEWQRRSSGAQPFLIEMRDAGRPFGMAGLWDRWRAPDGTRIDSCAILTTTPNELVGTLHDRMPVILAPDDFDLWLDPREEDAAKLLALLRAQPSEHMVMHPVSKRVNDPRHDDPECSTKVESPPDPQGSLF